jgi:hypothetical protein
MYEAHVRAISYKEFILAILKQERGHFIFKDHSLSLFIIRSETFAILINFKSIDKISCTLKRLVT